jgi:hypothetical protein
MIEATIRKLGNELARARWALALFAVVSAGCTSSAGPNAAKIATAIERASADCRLERESRIALSGIKMSAVKTLVKLSGETDAMQLLESMKRIEVATYRVPPESGCGDGIRAAPFGDTLAGSGWWPMVTERDGADSSWVYAHGDREGDLDGLFVVELDGTEIEVVRLEGHIDRIMAEALKTDSGAAGAFVAQLR